MEHIFYLDNDNKPSSRAQSAPGFKSRNASRPGTPGQVIYLPTLGAEVIVGENARIEVMETSTRSRRVWQDRTRFDERMSEYKRLRDIKQGGPKPVVDLDGFDPDYDDGGPNPLTMPKSPKQRVTVRPLDQESGLAAYFNMQGDWTESSPLSRPSTVSGGINMINENETLLGPRNTIKSQGSISSIGSEGMGNGSYIQSSPMRHLHSSMSTRSHLSSAGSQGRNLQRPATTQMVARKKYLKTPTHKRVKKDFKNLSRPSHTAPLERVRAKARRKRRKQQDDSAYTKNLKKFQMTSQILPPANRRKKKLAKVKGRCAMCSMKRSAFSDFCDRCALKLRVSRADVVKASRKAWVRSGRAATFMLELSEDDVAVTRLSFKEAKDAYRVVRDTRNASKGEEAGYETWEESLAHSNEAHHAAIKVQATFRGFRFRARYRAGLHSIVRLQSWYHGAKARAFYRWHHFRWFKAVLIQKMIRGLIAFRKIDVAGKRAGSVIMQCAFRCYIARVRLAILKWEELQRVRAVSALVIENAWRRKAAYIRCAYLRSLRDGATGFQKVWRMYILRIKYLSQLLDAVELQRHLRRWFAENEAKRRREERERKRLTRLKIENRAMTLIQRNARIWLARRVADRKREIMDNAQDDLDSAEVRYDEVSQQGLWPTSSHYTEYALMLMFDAAEWNEASRIFRHGLGREPKDPQLLFGFAILCSLRRSRANNDLEEADKRKKEALAQDVTRKAARRLEILFRVLIKMYPTNTLLLASYAVFHQFIRDHSTAAVYFQRAIKIDPYNNKVIGAFGQFEEEAAKRRAVIRGESASAWFSEDDFRFEDMTLETTREIKDSKRRKTIGLRVRCYFMGDNIMIKAKEIPRKTPDIMLELGLVQQPTEEEIKKETEEGKEYRVFLTGKDCAIFVKVLDMAYLLLPTYRKALLHKIVDRLVFQDLVVTGEQALGVEFRQEPWLHVTHVTQDKWFLSVMASCVDRVAERLAKTELLQATKPFEGSDMDSDEDDDNAKGRNKRGKNKRGKSKRFQKGKKKKKSPFEVVKVPAEMKKGNDQAGGEEEEDDYFDGGHGNTTKDGKFISHEERLSSGRSIVFVAYIYKIKRSYRLTVTGEQIRKLFVDQPLLVRKFLRPGWRLQARPLVLRLVKMLELCATNDTPRIYEKKMVLVDGKYVEKKVDVTPAHEPTRKLLLSRLNERMEEARLNIAATQIQKIARGHLGRKYAKEYLPWTSAITIQRVWLGYKARQRFKEMLYHDRRRRKSTKIQALARRYFQRLELSRLLYDKFPFSVGYWNKLWHAFSLQRRASIAGKSRKATEMQKIETALWYETMETPVSYQMSNKLYISVIETQGKVSAKANFGYGLLLLAQEKDYGEAKKYIEQGFRLDPGGRAFQVTEDAYFRRAALIKSENAESQMMYALLLLYVRNNPTTAQSYLDEAMILSELEIDSINYQNEEDARKEAIERKIEQEKKEEEEKLRKKRGGRLQPVPKTDEEKEMEESIRKKKKEEKERREKRIKILNQVKRVIDIANTRAQSFNQHAIPFQALWRGHHARCKHGPAVLSKLCRYEYKLMPENARVVARHALAQHAIKMNYKMAVSMYRLSVSIDPGDASVQFAFGLALVALSGLEDKPSLYDEAVEVFKLARDLDKASRSYQWFESEFFKPTLHPMWDPLRQYGVRVKNMGDLVLASLENKSRLRNDGNNEVRARIICNQALMAQWIREDYGQANKLYIEALLLSPADSMIVACYHQFFSQGLAVHLPKSELENAKMLRERLLNTRESREERELRLKRLEEERIIRVKMQGLTRDRAVREGAMDRIKEAMEREKMYNLEDHVLRAKIAVITRQREGIVGSVGKSAVEIAEERKKKREEARAAKRKQMVKNRKKDKKKKEKGGKAKKKIVGNITFSDTT